MHLQKAVDPFDLFVRCIGLRAADPHRPLRPGGAAARPLHDGRRRASPTTSDPTLVDTTLTINAFFGWDFNSCEALRKDGVWHPIDFANACPDSQVTSLHYHFPWLVTANLRWSIFCAATKRPMRVNLDWAPFFEIAGRRTGPTARSSRPTPPSRRERFETAEFEEFCAEHLAHLDEVVWDFFGTDVARDAVRQKVAALFPAHEIERVHRAVLEPHPALARRREATPSPMA